MYLFMFDVIAPKGLTVLMIVIAVCVIAAIAVGAISFAVHFSRQRKRVNRLLDKSTELAEEALKQYEETKESRRYPR